MPTRRRARPGRARIGLATAALTVIAVGAAGCGATTPGRPATPTTSDSASMGVDPAAATALAQATTTLSTTSFAITMTAGPGVRLTGHVDVPDSKGTATLIITGTNTTTTVTTLLVGPDLYVQVPGITKPGTWTHVDGSRLPAGATIGLRPGQLDPVNTAKLLTANTDVHRVDGHNVAGTLDLTKVAGVTGVDQITVDGLGAAATTIPFTAGLDDQGRLSVLTISLPAVTGHPAATLDIQYTDYGTPVQADRPAATTVTEAPDNLYSTLGGQRR